MGSNLQVIQDKIYSVRGLRVMLDFDLAAIYDIETRVLKQAVRRNIDRFPDDFMFELTTKEWNQLIVKYRSQFVIFDEAPVKRNKFAKYTPFAFTEQGVAMLSSVLRLPTARLSFRASASDEEPRYANTSLRPSSPTQPRGQR